MFCFVYVNKEEFLLLLLLRRQVYIKYDEIKWYERKWKNSFFKVCSRRIISDIKMINNKWYKYECFYIGIKKRNKFE